MPCRNGFRKPSRGVAVHTLVLVIMMAMFAIVAVFIFYKWTPTLIVASQAACEMKKITYCGDWKANGYGSEPWTDGWDKKQPLDCEQYGIMKPTDMATCSEILG
jgi:hypothetical protein